MDRWPAVRQYGSTAVLHSYAEGAAGCVQANVKEVEDLIAELEADPDYAAQAAQAAELGVNLDDPDVRPPTPPPNPSFPLVRRKSDTVSRQHASKSGATGGPSSHAGIQGCSAGTDSRQGRTVFGAGKHRAGNRAVSTWTMK